MNNRTSNALLAVVGIIAVVAVLTFPPKRDDTDPPDARSGMSLYTDARTGCQYLAAAGIGVTPRLGRDGRAMGCTQ